MNTSENNFTNNTNHEYDLNKNFANRLIEDSVCLVFNLLTGVSVNSLLLYLYHDPTFNGQMVDKFGRVLLSYVDLTVLVLGSFCGVVLNSNPVNVYSDSLCAFMLGSNMLLANLSGFCFLNIVTYRVFIQLYPLLQINERKRKLLTLTGMLFAIIFSIPSFIFYGETNIVFRHKNVTVVGKMCGVSGIADNGMLLNVYLIGATTIYAVSVLYLSLTQICFTVFIYRELTKWRQHIRSYIIGTLKHSNIENTSKIFDSYADKDFSVFNSNAVICSSCDQLETKTKYGTDSKLKTKSAYEMILDIDITIPENTNNIDETWVLRRMSFIFFIVSISQLLQLVVFACAAFKRASGVFMKSNDWSKISEIEYSWLFFHFSMLNSLLNPMLHSFLIIFHITFIQNKSIFKGNKNK